MDRPTAQLILSLLHPEAFKRPSAVEALQLPCLQQMMAPTVVPRPALILAAEGTTEAAVAATAMHDSVADATGGEHAVHALSSDSAHDAATEVIAQPAPGSAAADADPPAEAFARAAEPTSALDAGAVLEGEDEASNGPEEPPFWARAMCRLVFTVGIHNPAPVICLLWHRKLLWLGILSHVMSSADL